MRSQLLPAQLWWSVLFIFCIQTLVCAIKATVLFSTVYCKAPIWKVIMCRLLEYIWCSTIIVFDFTIINNTFIINKQTRCRLTWNFGRFVYSEIGLAINSSGRLWYNQTMGQKHGYGWLFLQFYLAFTSFLHKKHSLSFAWALWKYGHFKSTLPDQ
jgi:hypothetical protein